MKNLCLIAIVLLSASIVMVGNASADWPTGYITDIHIVNQGGANDKIVVVGSFSPSAQCQYNGFVIFPSDTFYRETYALVLAAKTAGQQIRFFPVYCMADGFARASNITAPGP